MKTKILYIISVMLLAFAGNIQADELFIGDVELELGQQKTVAVELNNLENQYIMLDFYIQLPAGITIARDESDELIYELNSDRAMRSHTLEISEQPGGNYHVLLYSSRNEALKGTSGYVFTMTLQAGETVRLGDYTGKLTNQITSDINKTEIDFPPKTFNIKVNPISTTDVLTIADFEISPGQQKTVAVELNNTENQYIMLDFYIQLPAGISIARDETDELIYELNSDRAMRSHSLEISEQSSGNYHVLLYSSRNEALKGTSGAVFSMSLKADDIVSPGDYTGKLTNQITSDVNKREIDFPERIFSIKVVKLPQSLSLEELPNMTYGDADFTLPVSTTEGLTVSWTSSDANVVVVSGNTLSVKGAGSATITASQTGDESHDSFSRVFTLTVNKAPLTVTAENKTKTAGEANPELTVSYEGFVNGEDEAVLTKVPTVTTTADETSVAGYYPITASDATAANYEITYLAGTLTVVKAEQNVTFSDFPAMTYGDEAYTLPTKADNGQTVTWTSSNPDVAEVNGTALTIKGAGSVVLTANQAGSDFYNPSTKDYNLAVGKASLIITADNKTRTVGEVNPELTISYEGFVNGEDENVLTKAPIVTTTANESSVAGDYPITVSGATAANYDITFMAGTLTVVKADQTMTLTDLPSMTYGDEDYTLPALTDNGQQLTWTSGNANVASVSGNTLSVKGAGTATVTASQTGDACHNPFSQTFTLTVSKAPLTITADNKTKVAGEENPELTVTYEGFVNSETESVLSRKTTIITTATKGSVAGDYPITVSGATAANYDITFIAGTLTVVKADQTMTLTDLPSMTYGDEDYTLPALTDNGQQLTWTSGNANVATVSGNTLSVKGAGTATVTASQAGDASHNPFSKTFTLTVHKAQLTIMAENKTKTAGEANPELTISYEGFVNGEDESVLTKKPVVTTTATTGSVSGDYPITASGATAANYDITYVAGTLTVVKSDQSVTLTELPSMTYGDAEYPLPLTTTEGQPLTWTSGNAKVADISGGTLTVTGAGTATVTASQAGDASHNPFSKTFTLTVRKAQLTIMAENKTKTAGEANPELTVSYEGFVNGEDETVLTKVPTLTTTATETSVAGEYPITVLDALAANYEISYVDGTMTVVKADQSVSLTELPVMTYGDSDYTLPAETENGQPLTWSIDNDKVAIVNGNSLCLKEAGTATITATQAGDASYNPFSQSFTLKIAKAHLTIIAENKTKTKGEVNPEFTLTYEGFVNGEDESVLTEIPQISCEADVTSPAGEYEIVLSGGFADNYELSLVNGLLTVEEPPHLRGDVNEDGKVNISDVVAAINQMAGNATWRYADVNEDTKVNISDIVAIINIMAGQ